MLCPRHATVFSTAFATGTPTETGQQNVIRRQKAKENKLNESVHVSVTPGNYLTLQPGEGVHP